ncbi:MAG: cytochrome C oxidase subunit IV [Acidimicrobiia bacterium]
MAQLGTQSGGAGSAVVAESHRHSRERSHPGPGIYVLVAVVLGVVTLLEVWVFYFEGVRQVIVPILLALSAAKFALVAGFYMHLRFDSPIFRRLFLVGIVTAIAIYAAVLAMFGTIKA